VKRCRPAVRVVTLSSAAAAIAASGALLLPVTASAGTAVGAQQHFIGLVNGSNDDPTLRTACPAGSGSSSSGPVAAKQTLEVAQTKRGHGYTGYFSQIYGWFQPPAGDSTRPTELTFTHYGKPKHIPATIDVPCSGTGSFVFSSCPYLAPCAYGWVQTSVRVTLTPASS
jgi:hypothetical protein